MDPVVVMTLSVVFIISVVMLHGKLEWKFDANIDSDFLRQ